MFRSLESDFSFDDKFIILVENGQIINIGPVRPYQSVGFVGVRPNKVSGIELTIIHGPKKYSFQFIQENKE